MISIQHWELRRLTDLAEYINGYAFKPEDWGEEGLPIIRIEQLRNPASISDFYSGKLSEKNIVQNGDLIFSWSASLFLRIWQYGNAVLNQHLFKVVEKEGVDRVFLKQFIEYYLPEIIKASHGSTMQHITRKELDRFGALFPTKKSEQSKIAEVLSKVDQAIEQTESLIAKQHRIKTGMMQDLLTRGIDEHGNLRSEETHEFKNSPLGRIPVEWDDGGFEKYVVADSGIKPGPFGSSITKDMYTTKGARVYGQEQVIGGSLEIGDYFISEAKFREMQPFAVCAGDVLLSLVGTIGHVIVVPKNHMKGIINPRLLRFRPHPDLCIPEFLREILLSEPVRIQLDAFATGGTMPVLSAGIIRSLSIPIVDIEEQRRIALALQAVDKCKNGVIEESAKLHSLRTALMQDLLTGKVRVTPLMENIEGKS